MANENDASVIVGGSVNNSKVRGGKIDTIADTESTKNNVSVSINKDVTESSEVEAGTIKVSESIDIAKLKVELREEIQPFVEQLAQSAITRNEAVATEAIKEKIKANPTLKQRLLNALKAGGIEALKAIFNHPVVSVSVETVKGFLEAN